jgi:uncharacterized membrane protein HdeD (DUF308 family)
MLWDSFLLIDGCLDIYKIPAGSAPNTKVAPLFSAVPYLFWSGILSFVSPIVTIFLLAFMMAIRIIIRGIHVFNDARKMHGKSAGLTWLYGALLVLCGLAVFIFPAETLLFAVYFITIYAFCDGAYLLTRGLLLRFAPYVLTLHYLPASEKLLDIPASFPATTRRRWSCPAHRSKWLWPYSLGF